MDIIIGAGISGLSSARALRSRGHEVIVIEQNKQIGYPIRSTGGIAKYFVDKLNIPSPSDVIASDIRSVDIRDDYGHHASISFDHTVGYVYDYPKFINNIANNIKVNTSERVIDIDYKNNIIHTDHDTYTLDRGDRLIVSSGPYALSLIPDIMRNEYSVSDDDTIVGYEETRMLGKRQDYDLVLWFTKYAPGGYFWDFPDSNGRRRIGLGVTKPHALKIKEYFMKFMDIHPELNGDVDHTISHLIPVAPPVKRVVYGDAYFVGDTVHTVFSTTGGGLQMGWYSGLKAGSSQNTMDYQNVWNKEIYHILMRHYKLKKFIYSLSDKQISKILDNTNNFRIRAENANDEIPRLALYLSRKMPSLLLKLMIAMS